MNKNTERTTELSLILAVCHMIEKVHRGGKVRGISDKLKKEVEKDLDKCPQLTKIEINYTLDKITEFYREIEWFGQARHLIVLVSFVSILFEQTEFRHNEKIIKQLNRLTEYYDTKNDLDISCMKEAEKAFEIWQTLK